MQITENFGCVSVRRYNVTYMCEKLYDIELLLGLQLLPKTSGFGPIDLPVIQITLRLSLYKILKSCAIAWDSETKQRTPEK